MHGDKDNFVPLAQSEVLAEALKKAGVEVKLKVVKGNGQGAGLHQPREPQAHRRLLRQALRSSLRTDELANLRIIK